MNKKKMLLVLITFSFSICSMSQNSNITPFNVTDDNQNSYYGYIEPRMTDMASHNQMKPKIIMFPKIVIDGVSVRDENGIIIYRNQLLDYKPQKLSVSVRISLVENNPDDYARHLIIWSVSAGIDKPISPKVLEKRPTPSGNPAIDAQNNQDYALLENKVWNSQVMSKSLLGGYEIFSVFPKGLNVKLLVDNEMLCKIESDPNSTTSSGSSYFLSFNSTDELFIINKILDGEYNVVANFLFLNSQYRSGSAFKDIKQMTAGYTSVFRKDCQNAISNSSGILFWETTSKNIVKYIEEESYKDTRTAGSKQISYVTRDDVDSKILDDIKDFLFPTSSLDNIIKSHEEAAAKELSMDNHELARLHLDYAKFLRENGTKASSNIDITKALAGLAEDNMIKFLANGFSFKDSRSSNKLQYRKFVQTSNSTQQTERFNALILNSIYESFVLNIAPENWNNNR